MADESRLPARYEIRTLEPKHSDWANALVMHSTAYSSPVWSKIYPDDRVGMCYGLFKAATYLNNHQIESGLSIGIFDKEYKYKRSESEETGGKLYWDLGDDKVDEALLLVQMDFPLVSVAMAYDSYYSLDPARVAMVLDYLPAIWLRIKVLKERDLRDPECWQATGPGQVIFRNATATKVGEEGRGFMALLARYMMRKAAADGFRGIEIGCMHDAVTHVWCHPPEPFRAEIVSRFNCASDEDEEIRRSFRGSDQEVNRVYVTLKS